MSAPDTERQQRFAIEYARNGGNATRAAITAGYSAHSAEDLGRRNFALPHVQKRIFAELLRLRARAGSVGLHTLLDVAESEKAPAAARVAAGRSLLEFAGLNDPDISDALMRAKVEAAPNYRDVLDAFARAGALRANNGAEVH